MRLRHNVAARSVRSLSPLGERVGVRGLPLGVLGVIGPTRLNYARVIPMVDYTAKVVTKIIGG